MAGKPGSMKNRLNAEWLDDAAAAQKPKARSNMFGRHRSMHRTNPAYWFARARAARGQRRPAMLTFGNPGAMMRHIVAPKS
jgi:hypothetical protein